MCIARLQQEELNASLTLEEESSDEAPKASAEGAETVPRPAEQVLVPSSSG